MGVAHADRVREYYDRNTRSFLRFGQGRGTGTIRRAIRAPGVATNDEAFHWADAEIARRLDLDRRAGVRIVDLGCGVGGSLAWLAERHDIVGTGVTLSPVQAEIGRSLLSSRRLRGSIEIVAADLHDFVSNAPLDAAIAIESFVLVPDASRFFRHARSLLRPGGVLVVVDDFLVCETLDARAARLADDFRRGWRVQSLVTPAEAVRLARSEGFEVVNELDLTPYLELDRPRDLVIRQLVRPMRLFPSLARLPALANLIGGDALQRGLRSGVFTHRLLELHAV